MVWILQRDAFCESMNNESTTYYYAYIKNTWLKSHGVRVMNHFQFVHFDLEFSHLSEGVA
jgi:hypothetical protein